MPMVVAVGKAVVGGDVVAFGDGCRVAAVGIVVWLTLVVAWLSLSCY